MEEYAGLLKIGFVIGLVALVAMTLRVMGVGRKGKGKGKGRKKNKGKEKLYQQEAYVDHGDGNTDWQDSDVHAMKEGKGKSRGMNDLFKKKKKKQEAFENWDDY